MIANMQKELDFCIGIQDDTFNSTVLYENIFRNMGLEQCYTTETFEDDLKKLKMTSKNKNNLKKGTQPQKVKTAPKLKIA